MSSNVGAGRRPGLSRGNPHLGTSKATRFNEEIKSFNEEKKISTKFIEKRKVPPNSTFVWGAEADFVWVDREREQSLMRMAQSKKQKGNQFHSFWVFILYTKSLSIWLFLAAKCSILGWHILFVLAKTARSRSTLLVVKIYNWKWNYIKNTSQISIGKKRNGLLIPR